MSEDRVFALADKTFPSLEALHAWFNAQIAGTKDHGERSELRLADRVATARHVERTKAAANEPPAAPPPAPLAPEPFPPEASDRPGGNVPPVTAKVYGPVPPEAVKLWPA